VPYTLRYHPRVADQDLKPIPAETRRRIARSIDARLATAPERYGVPLTGSLRGYWKLRVGDYRAVFKITSTADVLILAILHRKHVYERAARRAD